MKFLKNFQILMKRQMEKTSDLGSPAALVLIFLHRWVWVHAETIMSDTKTDPNEAHVFQPPRTSWNTLKCSSKYHKTYLEDFAVLLLNIKTSKFPTGNIRTILHHITFFFLAHSGTCFGNTNISTEISQWVLLKASTQFKKNTKTCIIFVLLQYDSISNE